MFKSELFWKRVEVLDETDCWHWRGRIEGNGYGSFSWYVGPGQGTKRGGAHRLAYQLIRGSIPPNMVLDHLCRVRSCVNPWHLEAVTQQVNVQRGISAGVDGRKSRWAGVTHCKRGHPFEGHNLIITARGTRACRLCQNAAVYRYQAKKRAASD